jgi:hypothetical protein
MRGFNDGYLISQHDPELSEAISKAHSQSDRLSGMKEGRSQYMKEQLKEKRPSWLKNEKPGKAKSEPDKSKGKDIQPEK